MIPFGFEPFPENNDDFVNGTDLNTNSNSNSQIFVQLNKLNESCGSLSLAFYDELRETMLDDDYQNEPYSEIPSNKTANKITSSQIKNLAKDRRR